MRRSLRSHCISRRCFLQQSGLASVVVATGVGMQTVHAVKPTDYERLDSDAYLGAAEVLAKVEDEKVFAEGPAVDGDGNVLFTNVPVSKILKWSPKTKQLTVFRENSHETNGLYFAPDGSLLACEGGARRVTRTDLKTGKISVLADSYLGRPFAKPNDLCLDRKGRIYFTSRTAVKDPPNENLKAVYRVDPNGTVTQILAWPDVHMPNGIVLSPDESKLSTAKLNPTNSHDSGLSSVATMAR